MILRPPEPTEAQWEAMGVEARLRAPATGTVIHDLTASYHPDTKYDLDKVHALFTRMACPVVCRGYLDGGENWHELCLNKADEIMRQLDMTPPTRPAPPTAPQPQKGTS